MRLKSAFLMRFLFLSFLSLLMCVQGYSQVPNDLNTTNGLEISYNESDLNLKYGVYDEVEFFLNGNNSNAQVEWKILEPNNPIGMVLIPTQNNSALLYGTPMFVDRWCFLVSATVNSSTKVERVCLYGYENEQMTYPKISTNQFLPDAYVNQNYQTRIEIQNEMQFQNLNLQFVFGNLPSGFNLDTNTNGYQTSLNLSGVTTIDGSFDFVLMAIGTDVSGNQTYVLKQFQLDVANAPTNSYQCPPGYYYDQTVNYCVQASGDYCQSGSYYDEASNQCIPYVNNDYYNCGPGYYYDQFLFRCVRETYNRCPYNYEWDPYYNQCVRQPYSCGIGYSYNYSTRSCVYVGQTLCPVGSYYDAYRRSCIRYSGYCSIGTYYSSVSGRCMTSSRFCGMGSYWDSYYGSCRPTLNYSHCRPGSYYDYSYERCEVHVYQRHCPSGSRYSYDGSCMPYRPIDTYPRPPHINRPPVRPPVHVGVPPRPPHNYNPGHQAPPRPPHGPVRPQPPVVTNPNPPRPPHQGPVTPPVVRPNPPSHPQPSQPTRPTPPVVRPNPPSHPQPSQPTRPTPPVVRPNPPSHPQPSRPSNPTPPSRPSNPSPSRPNQGGGGARPPRPPHNM